MKYKVKLTHETRTINAADFNIIGNMMMFYNGKDKAIYAFSNVVSVEKVEEGDNR